MEKLNVEHLRPLSVSHENSHLYSLLKESIHNNAELRISLLDAAEMIQKLTEELWKVKNEGNT